MIAVDRQREAPTVEIPPIVNRSILHVSVSGGRDSTAAALALRDAGLDAAPVFWDTGWEHEATYDYVDRVLPEILGRPVRTVAVGTPALPDHLEAAALHLERAYLHGRRSGMVRLILHKAMFPSAIRARWCTQMLKIDASRAVAHEVIASGGMPLYALGIRAEESAARARQPEVERMALRRETVALAPSLDAWTWRPILGWSAADVADIHRRHNAPMNPLYAAGAGRVGCWPCIGAGKTELRLLDERRIRCIEELEAIVGEEWRRRNPAAVADNMPAFFQAATRRADGVRPCTPIREMVAWAATARGGRQMLMRFGGGGCVSGMCEAGDA